ncbi:hypothetical protein BDFG_01147 [Blastomyces dermatitidis ATCC 26199]|nr:hypothetical protein BDFG_01147 [Blastomyces dermatitidis ATCC 26199]
MVNPASGFSTKTTIGVGGWNKERIEEHNGIIWIQDKRLVEKSGWKSVILERIFQRVVQGLGDRELQTYVDALDECGDSELREIFTHLPGEPPVSDNRRNSRHRDRPRQTNSACEDIERYIKSKLSPIYKNENPRRFMHLQSSILEKSRGIFLWVSLVIEILNGEIVEDRAHDLEICLQQIPEELKDLFGLILRRNQHQNYSLRPSGLKEYYFAVNDYIPELADHWELDEERDSSRHVMCRFVTYSSMGFPEVVKAKGKSQWIVQFIHETIRDLLLRNLESGNEELFKAKCHKVMRDRCLVRSPISSPVRQVSNSSSFWENTTSLYREPWRFGQVQLLGQRLLLLPYAVSSILEHARFIENEPKGEAFIDCLPWDYWIYFHNIFVGRKACRYASGESLKALAKNDLPSLVRVALRRSTFFQWKVHAVALRDAYNGYYGKRVQNADDAR